MNPEELRSRTKKFALRVIALYRALPHRGEAQVVGNQLLRSGTAVAANYRSACRARSRAEFVARVAIVEEEADESAFWLELLGDSATVKPKRLAPLLDEAGELTAIFTATRQTAKRS